MILDIDGTTTSPIVESLIGKSLGTQGHLHRHFNIPGHRGFLNDVSVTLIEKTD